MIAGKVLARPLGEVPSSPIGPAVPRWLLDSAVSTHTLCVHSALPTSGGSCVQTADLMVFVRDW